ncbi:hypothetical protein BDR04DRAFT_1163397 [Suillus decipiens]|nr:hypothetical protein BDR04DRAFT_1163397 [Suillus decipiens]
MSHTSDETVATVDTLLWNSVVNVLGDVVFLDIQNVISLHGTYCFNLHTPSTKVNIEEAVKVARDIQPELIVASPCNLLMRHISNPIWIL